MPVVAEIPPFSEEVDIWIEQGANFDPVLTWTDENDDPQDLTGYTAMMEIRTDVGGTVLATYTTSDVITLGGVAGTITFNVLSTSTLAYDPVVWDNELVVYDLHLIVGATTRKLIRGHVHFITAVTGYMTP